MSLLYLENSIMERILMRLIMAFTFLEVSEFLRLFTSYFYHFYLLFSLRCFSYKRSRLLQTIRHMSFLTFLTFFSQKVQSINNLFARIWIETLILIFRYCI